MLESAWLGDRNACKDGISHGIQRRTSFGWTGRSRSNVVARGGSEFQLVLPGMLSGRNPDLGVVLRGTPKDWRGRIGPSLVAEVVSRDSVTRDYQIKREEYLAFGLLEYWIVDPFKRQVTVLTRHGDVWSEAIFRDSDTIVSLVLPGNETTVADLWIDVDQDDEHDGGANGA